MRKIHFLEITVLVIALISMISSAWDVPGLINYQGNLTDPNGVELNGDYEMSFSLYNTETEGSSLWREQQTVKVTKGIYNVNLGDTNPLNFEIFNNDTLYLEVQIGEETLTPRQHLTSTPFAIKAGNVAKAGDADTVNGIHAADLEESVEIDNKINAHKAIPDAHHNKTTSFSELTDQANDGQIPDDITIIYAGMSGNADTVDGKHANAFMPAEVEVTYNGVTKKIYNQGQTFYVAPDNQVVSGNDGMSVGSPIKLSDVETIFNAIKPYFGIFQGTWTIKLSAGTYFSDSISHMLYLSDIDSINYINIEGESVEISEIPKTVLDGKTFGNEYCHGMFFQNMNVKISNIKFQNFTEEDDPDVRTGTRAGLALSGFYGKVWVYNIHTYNCSWGGLINQGIPRLYVEGGKFEYCRQGIVSMFNTQVSIGYHGSSLNEPEKTRLINCIEAGILLLSQACGHVDYCIFDSNKNRGLILGTSSEVNAVMNEFRNNNIAISVQSNSRLLNSSNTFINNKQDYDLFYSGYVQQTANSDSGNRRRDISELIAGSSPYSYFVNSPNTSGEFFSQQIHPSSLFGRGKNFNLVAYGRVSNLNSNNCDIIIKVTDGTNTTTLQTIKIPTTGGFKAWKLELYLSNYTQSVFMFNSDFMMEGNYPIIKNTSGITLDSRKEITVSLELEINGTDVDTDLDTYRILPKVVF